MCKFLRRTFSVLLILCLIVDPGLAAAITHQQSLVGQPIMSGSIQRALFCEQSLSVESYGSQRPWYLQFRNRVAVILGTTGLLAQQGLAQNLVKDQNSRLYDHNLIAVFNLTLGLVYVLRLYFLSKRPRQEKFLFSWYRMQLLLFFSFYTGRYISKAISLWPAIIFAVYLAFTYALTLNRSDRFKSRTSQKIVPVARYLRENRHLFQVMGIVATVLAFGISRYGRQVSGTFFSSLNVSKGSLILLLDGVLILGIVTWSYTLTVWYLTNKDRPRPSKGIPITLTAVGASMIILGLVLHLAWLPIIYILYVIFPWAVILKQSDRIKNSASKMGAPVSRRLRIMLLQNRHPLQALPTVGTVLAFGLSRYFAGVSPYLHNLMNPGGWLLLLGISGVIAGILSMNFIGSYLLAFVHEETHAKASGQPSLVIFSRGLGATLTKKMDSKLRDAFTAVAAPLVNLGMFTIVALFLQAPVNLKGTLIGNYFYVPVVIFTAASVFWGLLNAGAFFLNLILPCVPWLKTPKYLDGAQFKQSWSDLNNPQKALSLAGLLIAVVSFGVAPFLPHAVPILQEPLLFIASILTFAVPLGLAAVFLWWMIFKIGFALLDSDLWRSKSGKKIVLQSLLIAALLAQPILHHPQKNIDLRHQEMLVAA